MKSLKFIFALFCLIGTTVLMAKGYHHEAGAFMAIGPIATRSNVMADARRRLNNLDGAYNNNSNALRNADGDYSSNPTGYNNIQQMFKAATGKANKWYTITLVNANAAVRNAIICAGLQFRLPSGAYIAGLIQTGAFNDTAGGAGLTGAGAPTTIEFLNDFLQKVPSKLLGMRLSTTDTGGTQMAQNITIQPQTPFGQAANYPVSIANFKDDTSFNANIALLPVPVQVDNQTQVTIPVVGLSTLTVTLYFDVFANVAGVLAAN
jgi:hypothetical protein